MLEFVGIKKRFGDKTVLDDVSLSVPEGVVQFVIGTSGTGKSVLMKHVVGLIRPDSGQVLVDGVDVARLSERQFYAVRRHCGMVFQHSTLFDSMSLVDNVALPIRKHSKLSRSEAHEQALAALELVHMHSYAKRFPAELGAGLQKRAAIARALAMKPKYLVYDEPTTGLDPVAARRVDRLIREMADKTGVTSLVVSHDLTSILSISDRIGLLYGGKLRFLGTADELRACEDALVRQFVSGAATGPIVI